MAYVDIDEAAVDQDLWERAKAGDQTARDQIRAKLDGVTLRSHIFSEEENDCPVTIRELREAGIAGSITFHSRK